MTDNIDIHEIMPISFLKKEPFTGSHKGMRYRLSKKTSEDDEKSPVLNVCIWPQPFCFEKTEDSEKTWHEFEFSREGIAQAVEWMNERYQGEKKRWTKE